MFHCLLSRKLISPTLPLGGVRDCFRVSPASVDCFEVHLTSATCHTFFLSLLHLSTLTFLVESLLVSMKSDRVFEDVPENGR